MTWRDLELAAPGIAEPGGTRLEATRVALLATLRRDGSPRISPVEPFFAEGHLLFGAMAWTLKVRDLERDPRCTLHSAITGPNEGEGELKLYGRAIDADEDVRAACREGWWIDEPPESARVFSLDIEEAAFVTWDYERGEMTLRRWSPGIGLRTTQRSYP
jgi:predicted pyridoxine 5'-phosphate oxidase superfamily flavin-nucleotide-binding protein